jgi:hypothetical protein
VRVLEARFHPGPRERVPPVVVGHLIWADTADPRLVIEPSLSLPHEESLPTLLSRLRHLIDATAPDSFVGLQDLRSIYWSFLDDSPVHF